MSAGARQRRSSGEVDALILDAAREMFASKGYAGTSSREIAKRAGVHEPAIYRRFGSKAGLFGEAVLSPINEALSAYLEAWEGQLDEPESVEALVRHFVMPLFEVLTEHRELVLALLAAREFHAEALGSGRPALDALMQRMDTQAEVESLRRRLGSSANAKLTVRVATAMVMGMALFSDWLLPSGKSRVSESEVADEMVRLVTYGVAERGDAPDLSGEAYMSPGAMTQLLERLADAERRAVRAELELERVTAKPKPKPKRR